MTDLTDLLDSAAGDHSAPAPDVVGADLARGRRALVRRRWTRTGLAVAGVAAVGAAAVAVPVLGGGHGQQQVVGAAVGGGSVADAPNPGVDLVDYDAKAPLKPISPGVIPDGWSVSGDEHALVIAPPGNDTSPADFQGKLVVYLGQGIPNEPLPRDDEVAVGDRTGYANRSDSTALQVWVRLPDGTALRAQAPAGLGWDEATLGRFLGAVTVDDRAVASAG